MAREIVRRQVRFLAAVVLIPLLMGVFPAIAVAHEGEPSEAVPEIPTAAVDVEGLVEEIVRDAGGIEDSVERFRELSYVLYNLRAATSEQRGPVIKALEETAREVDDPQTLFSLGKNLVVSAPELSARITLQRGGKRLGDTYLRDLISQFAAVQPKRARELFDKLTDPGERRVALGKYAKKVPGNFKETCRLLEEIAGEEWTDFVDSYALREKRLAFAASHPAAMCEFLREHFDSQSVVSILTDIVWHLSDRREAPEAAEMLFEQARELLPQTKDPFAAAMGVLRSGEPYLSKTEAGELFEKYVWPEIAGGSQESELPLAVMSKFGMLRMASYAREVAQLQERAMSDVLSGVLRRAAKESDPDLVLDWLKSQPPSQVRAICVAETAAMLQHEFHSTARDRSEIGRRWLTGLADLAAEIEDDRTRWETYDSLLTIAKDVNASPDELRQKWWDLRLQFERTAAGEMKRISPDDFYKLPVEEQKRRLEDQLDADVDNSEYWRREQHGPSPTLRRIRESSLSNADKEQLYRRMIPQADIDPLAVAQIAGALAEYDYAEALDLIWWILPSERDPKHGLGMCPYPEAPRNARMALQMLSGGRRHYLERGEGDEVIDALWAFANRALDKDRDAVLEELAGVLTEQGDLDKALGVARRIEDVTARMRCLGSIVAVASGATQEG